MSEPFLFSSPEGLKLVEKTLKQELPLWELHVYQLTGICKLLDGVDLIAVTPTGSGKTGFFFLTLLAMKAFGNRPSLLPANAIIFPKDPIFVAICPTNTIEMQIESNMSQIGIKALAINAETVAAGRACLPPINLWELARESASIILMGPEQLISKGFADLLNDEQFCQRVSALGVDEIHLLVAWGQSFRVAFTQIGHMRRRFREGMPLVGLTATLHTEGPAADSVFALLGVNRGEFYLIRRSNARYDIQVLFRTLLSGINGMQFPELTWILEGREKTLIFAASINLVFRLKMFFHNLLLDDVDKLTRVRTVHSLHWQEENEESIAAMKNDLTCQILIATNTLAQGTDIASIQTVIHIGEPESSDMYVQKAGRAGRDRRIVTHPKAIYYIPKARMLKAAKVVSQTDEENMTDDKKTRSSHHTSMTRGVAMILMAPCKPAEQDKQYNNPDVDTQIACHCTLCTIYPPTIRPTQCNCSGCLPEPLCTRYIPQPKPKTSPLVRRVKDRLTKAMKKVGHIRLREFRLSIWKANTNHKLNMLPIAQFLPDFVMTYILDRFANFKSTEDVHVVTQFYIGMEGQATSLYSFMQTLIPEFEDLRKLRAQELKEKKRLAAIKKLQKERIALDDSEDDDEDVESDEDLVD